MNKFNDRQRECIVELARSYHEKLNENWKDYMPEPIMVKMQQDYIDAIIEGLTEPNYWGLDKPVFEPLD